MNYDSALKAARKGSLIRRSIWVNTLRFANGVLEFTTAVRAYSNVPDRSYDPTDIDRASKDWGIAN